jgi:hypothetical protein
MLKNKKAIYILLPLNIFIWGYLAYSIYAGLKGNEEELPNTKNESIPLAQVTDTNAYRLKLNYTDPFLKENAKYHEPRTNNGNATANTTKTNNPVSVIKTPTVAAVKPVLDVKYLGIVKNNTTGISTALISINGKTYIIKKGDVVESLVIKDVFNDYVEIKEGKTISKISK